MMTTTTRTDHHSADGDDAQISEWAIAAAREAAVVLAAEANESERLGHLTDRAAIQALDDAGVLKILAPKIRGGHELPVQTFNRVSAELAKGCGSASWVAGIYIGVLYMLASFSDEAQDEIYSVENPKVIAAFNPVGQAIPTEGGYRLSGKWPFCTGQHHAHFGMMSSLIIADGADPEPAQFIISRNDASVVDDWQVRGLAGTGSNTLILDDVFIPEHRVLRISVPASGGTLSRALADNPYYRTPTVPFFSAGSAGLPLGIAEKALELLHERIRKRGITYTGYTRQSEAVVTHLQMDEATMKLDQARFHADRAAATAGEINRDPSNIALRVRCRADSAWVIRLCREVLQIVQQAAGAGGIHRRDPFSRMFNDLHAISVHSFLLFSTNAELHGRVLCGLDPDTPFV